MNKKQNSRAKMDVREGDGTASIVKVEERS